MLLDEAGRPIVWPEVPWSFSALETFESCGWKYRETKTNARKGNYPFVETEAMKNGKVTHKQLEDFVAMGAPLPMMLQSMGNTITKLATGARDVLPERPVNLTHELEPCGTFDANVSYRGVVDLTIIRPDQEAIIVDYKTGKNPKDSFDQLEFNALAVLCEYPGVKAIHAGFYYTKFGFRRMPKFTREDAVRVAKALIPRLTRLKDARDMDRFVPTPGPLCKWCPVETCQFNPKFVRV